MTDIDFIIVGIFLCTTILMGSLCAFFYQRADQYMAGDRNFSGWIMGVSLFATYVSNIALISLPALMVSDGLTGYMSFIVLPLVAFITNRYFIKIFREKRIFSVYSYIQERFGRLASSYTILCYCVMSLARMAIIIFLLGVSLNTLIGIEARWVVMAICAIVCAYTSIGGMKAVIYTDVFQGFILIGCIVAVLISSLFLLFSGETSIISHGDWSTNLKLGQFSLDFTKASIWILLLDGLFFNLQGYVGEQSSVNRLLVAKSDAAAKKGLLIGSILTAAMIAVIFIIGGVYYLIEASSHVTLEQQAFVGDMWTLNVFHQYLPVGIKGLLVAGIIASAMSSLDSEIHANSTIYFVHIHSKFTKKSAKGQNSYALGAASVVVALFSMAIALTIEGFPSMVNVWWKCASMLSVGSLTIFILGVFVKNLNKSYIVYGIILSALFTLWAAYSPLLPKNYSFLKNPIDAQLTLSLSVIFTVVLGAICSKFERFRNN